MNKFTTTRFNHCDVIITISLLQITVTISLEYMTFHDFLFFFCHWATLHLIPLQILIQQVTLQAFSLVVLVTSLRQFYRVLEVVLSHGPHPHQETKPSFYLPVLLVHRVPSSESDLRPCATFILRLEISNSVCFLSLFKKVHRNLKYSLGFDRLLLSSFSL